MLLHGSHSGKRNFLYLKRLLQEPGEYYLPSGEYYLEITYPLSIASNVRLSCDQTLFKVKSSPIHKHFAIIDGEKNIIIEGLRFESTHNQKDTNPKWGDFNNSNIRGFRVRGGSDNIRFHDLHFEQFDIIIEVKEDNQASAVRNTNISLENVAASRCILPLYFQQTKGLRLKYIDLDCELIGGRRMKHIYINKTNEDLKATNIICRRGQGYTIQVLGGLNDALQFENVTFEDTLNGIVLQGDIRNFSMNKVRATYKDWGGVNEGVWVMMLGGNIRNVNLSRWYIDGGRTLYDERNPGINDVSLSNFEVQGLTATGIKHRYSKIFSLSNSIVDFDGFGPFLECASLEDSTVNIDTQVSVHKKNKVLIREDCKSDIKLRGIGGHKNWLQDLRK